MKSSSRTEWIPLVMAPGRASGVNTAEITGNSNSITPFRVPLYLDFEDTGSGVPSGRNVEVTFVRIVGQYSLSVPTNVSGQEELWWSLTMLAPIPFDYETGALLETGQINSPAEFESHARPEVMWQRFHMLVREPTSAATSRQLMHTYMGTQGYPQSVIDIRVKRRLSNGQALMLAVTNHTFSTDRQFFLKLALKALVMFKGN